MCYECYGYGEKPSVRRQMVEVEDFYEEVNYQPKKKDKRGVKRYPGCPENNRGPHVYAWTTEFNGPSLFFDYFGFHKRERKVCVGCLHEDARRFTEEYNNRNEREFAKRPPRRYSKLRWFRFEDHDEGYRAKRKAYLQRYGWDYDYIY